MAPEPLNRNLHAARATKQDEFYTQLSDIERELRHYSHHFKGKTVLCNCDDPKVSSFFTYFSRKFKDLKLKRLITTCYQNQDANLFSAHEGKLGVYLVYEGERTPGGRVPTAERIGIFPFDGDGDFRSEECIALLKQADIVVTNPPFSLFREYISQLVEHDKKFVIVGNKNAVTYAEMFVLIKENRLWLGNTPMGSDMLFEVSEGLAKHLLENKKEGSAYRMVNGRVMARSQSCWFTNLDIARRHEDLTLYRSFDLESYPKFDYYRAVNVDRTAEIPSDYQGVLGVPISFLDKYNPSQFEIVDANTIRRSNDVPTKSHGLIKDKESAINGKPKYVRIPIRRKRQ